jgi:NitT/TauT family transport system permease protein
VKLRSAVPQFVVGLKAALPQALIGAMVGEFIAARRGLGYLIAQAAGKFDTAGVFAALFVLAALVLFMFVCLQAGSKALREPPR